jgi:hypothetical protein
MISEEKRLGRRIEKKEDGGVRAWRRSLARLTAKGEMSQ